MKRKWILLLSLLFIVATAMGAPAQSQDRDNPTPFASNTVKGSGTGKKVEYFYSFTAGPGEVAITVDLKAKAGSTNADVEIFDEDGSKTFYYYPNATSQNEHAVKRFSLNSKQLLTLRLALDSSAGAYSIKLAGPVEFAAATPATDPQTPGADTSTAASSAGEQTPPATDMPQPDPSTATLTDATPKPGKGSKFDLALNLLQTTGTHFGLPTSGMLHVVMKDGTTQDIDLSKVKSASVTKP
jgi:hypothetical protein